MVRSIDSSFDFDCLSGLIANAVYFTLSTACSETFCIQYSLYNLHGDGVEHPDKTLMLGGIGRG